MRNIHSKTLRRSINTVPLILSCCSAAVLAEVGSYKLEEVSVTAQKKAESLEDVPISVSVMDGDDLKDFRVDNLFDLVSFTPGMVFSKAPDDVLILV